MKTVMAITKRELKAYFATPIAAVFLIIFYFLTIRRGAVRARRKSMSV